MVEGSPNLAECKAGHVSDYMEWTVAKAVVAASGDLGE